MTYLQYKENILVDCLRLKYFRNDQEIQKFILKLLCDGEYLGYTDLTFEETDKLYEFFKSSKGLEFISTSKRKFE